MPLRQTYCPVSVLSLVLTLLTAGRIRPTFVRHIVRRNTDTIAVRRMMASLSCLKCSAGKCSHSPCVDQIHYKTGMGKCYNFICFYPSTFSSTSHSEGRQSPNFTTSLAIPDTRASLLHQDTTFIQNTIDHFRLLRKQKNCVPEWFQIIKKNQEVQLTYHYLQACLIGFGTLFRIFSLERCQSYSYANKNCNVYLTNTRIISISFSHAQAVANLIKDITLNLPLIPYKHIIISFPLVTRNQTLFLDKPMKLL